MKPTSVFMNIGRGTTVKEEDLCKALKSGQIAGAVLDVYKDEPLGPEREIFECPNLLMTPHCAD
jgi:phosphoglycerate dehydrogenase-like enzyme